MPELKWIKLYTKMFDDEKIQVIEQSADGEVVINIWVKLLCLAGKTNAGGYIFLSENIPYSEATLAAVLHKPALTVRQAIGKLEELGMLKIDTQGIYLTHWETYQTLDSLEHRRELQRERTAKFREKQKSLQSGDMAFQNNKPFLKCNDKTLQVTMLPKPENDLATINNECNEKSLQVTQCNDTDIEVEEDKDKEIDKDNKTIQKDSGDNNGNDEILKEILQLPQWKNSKDDKKWVDELKTEFNSHLTVSVIRACRDWHLEHHPRRKHIWRTALRNWLNHEETFEKERSQNVRTRENPANHSAGVFEKLSKS